MAPIAVLEDVGVRWPAGPDGDGTQALSGISLSIEAGEVLGVVGLTGAGRSTLVRTLNGIVPHLVHATVDGRISVSGRSPAGTAVADMAAVVAIVLDDPEAQMTQPTVADEVAFGLENLGVEPDEIRGRVGHAIERVGLGGLEDRDPLTMSGGEQQRLAVAAAIAMRPALLVLDEPTANLDPASARLLLGIARDVARGGSVDAPTAVVVVSADIDLLAEHVDRVAWLRDGRLEAVGEPGQVFTQVALGPYPELAPAVTRLCAALAPGAASLPVTVEAAVAWLDARR